MKLFEATFRNGFDTFERYYDTDLKRSMQSKITTPCEWYEPSSKGLYTYILDDTLKLEKRQGRAKNGRDQMGFINPMYRNIRDNYWNQDRYNMNPRTWYLDIETRVGQSFTCTDYPHKKLTVRNKTTLLESQSTVLQLQTQFSDNCDDVEYYDSVNSVWKELKSSMYFERNTGFPVPNKALESISLFQIYDTETKIMFVLGLRDWKHQEEYDLPYEVRYVNCENEHNLIETFLSLFKKLDPLIVQAWNGSGFDYPYIYNRLKRLGFDTNRLSNYGEVSYKENEYQGMTEYRVTSAGHFFIDTMQVYKKFTFKPVASYNLDFIAEVELNKHKVSHTEYAAFDDFYTGKYILPTNPTQTQKESRIYKEAIAGNWDKVRELAHSEFVYYGCEDTFLVKEIDDKKNFTALMCMISEKMGVQISDSMGTVKPWSQYIANRSILNMQVMPKQQEHESPNVVGGYVREPEVGKHKWVLSADVNSMYPLLGMVGFNMSPETFVKKHELPDELRDIVLAYYNNQIEAERFNIPEDVKRRTSELLKEHNLSLGINGAAFKQVKKGLVPELVTDIYATRKDAKQMQLKYENRKILLQQIRAEVEKNNTVLS